MKAVSFELNVILDSFKNGDVEVFNWEEISDKKIKIVERINKPFIQIVVIDTDNNIELKKILKSGKTIQVDTRISEYYFIGYIKDNNFYGVIYSKDNYEICNENIIQKNTRSAKEILKQN